MPVKEEPYKCCLIWEAVWSCVTMNGRVIGGVVAVVDRRVVLLLVLTEIVRAHTVVVVCLCIGLVVAVCVEVCMRASVWVCVWV